MSHQMPKNFQELREIIWAEKQDTQETIVDLLEELTPFQLGHYQGMSHGFDQVLDILRNVLKYGDDE